MNASAESAQIKKPPNWGGFLFWLTRARTGPSTQNQRVPSYTNTSQFPLEYYNGFSKVSQKCKNPASVFTNQV